CASVNGSPLGTPGRIIEPLAVPVNVTINGVAETATAARTVSRMSFKRNLPNRYYEAQSYWLLLPQFGRENSLRSRFPIRTRSGDCLIFRAQVVAQNDAGNMTRV